MYYVYCEFMMTRIENYVGVYKTAGEAIRKIESLYAGDKNKGALGDYYYFMKQH